ncbi:MAG: TetR family transcriptional regulator [Actinomycetales bacterium]|nr:TetR family transcriptional regulator [Actinomycetales bacterium]
MASDRATRGRRPEGDASAKAAAKPRGRRPGASTAREDILDAARELFAERGYDGTSTRAIAAAAAVDPALINHYFGGKEGLFQAVMELPVHVLELAAQAFADATPDDLAHRMLDAFLLIWESPDTAPAMTSMLRRSLADPDRIASIRAFMTAVVLQPAAARLHGIPPQEARLRMSLVATALVGTMVVRRIVCLEPVASMPSEQLRALLLPTVTRCLTGELPIVNTNTTPAEGTSS